MATVGVGKGVLYSVLQAVIVPTDLARTKADKPEGARIAMATVLQSQAELTGWG